ncbi:MAG TPA: hypothetical protein EYH34_06295 [Planctomycetes bacterium]|nr:hypothetical protein [Planctomycetota bacterium]
MRIVVPDSTDHEALHDVIYNELCVGPMRAGSKTRYAQITARLVPCGAQGIILGCTHIGLLIDEKDRQLTVLDSTGIHARAAVDYAFETVRKW